jgi:hypothetical protein
MELTITECGKINIRSGYRNIFLALFTLFISVVASTQPHMALTHNDFKEVNITGEYQGVEVWGNITVILTNTPSDVLLMEGNAEDFDLVKTTITEGKLEIRTEEKKSLSKLIVYVSAKDVKSMTVNGDAEILSAGTINTSDLKILLNGESKVRVRYHGNLKVIPGNEYELVNNRAYRK